MKNTTLLTALLLCLSGTYANAESSVNILPKSEVCVDDDIKSKWDAALGTFQFEILNTVGTRNVSINMEIIHEILENRHETDIVYIEYNENIRVKILPENQISGDFEPLELMVHVESFE